MRANSLPMGIDVLAAQHRLGAPLRAHRWSISYLALLGCILGGLTILVYIGTGLYATLNPTFPPTAVLAFPREWYTYIGCAIGGLAGVGAFLYGLDMLKKLRMRAWECEEGFLVFDEKGMPSAALRWDQIQQFWCEVKVSHGARGGTIYERTYWVQGMGGQEVKLNYPHLWRRMENEFVHLHLPEALATINAGQSVSFYGVVVSAQGIANQPTALHIPRELSRSLGQIKQPTALTQRITSWAQSGSKPQPWLLTWSMLTGIKLSKATIEFVGPGLDYRSGTILPLGSVSNVCLLGALVQTLSGGRLALLR